MVPLGPEYLSPDGERTRLLYWGAASVAWEARSLQNGILQNQSQRMLERGKVMVGVFLVRDTWRLHVIGMPISQASTFVNFLVNQSCVLPPHPPPPPPAPSLPGMENVVHALSHLLELLNKPNLNWKIAVGLLKTTFFSKFVVCNTLNSAVLKSKPSLFSFGPLEILTFKGKMSVLYQATLEGSWLHHIVKKCYCRFPKVELFSPPF